MPHLVKIAVLKENCDLLRIIPFNPSESSYDFKISLLKNKYQIRIFELNKPRSLFLLDDIAEWEFSYHGHSGQKPAKIHAKHMSLPATYKDIPLSNMIDLKINSEFPQPLMKIGVSVDATFKQYKKKDQYSVLDMQKGNVGEFYILNKNFNMDQFQFKWDIFHFLFLVLPMEYYSDGQMNLNLYKMNFFADSRKETYFTQSQFTISEDIRILINTYYDPYFDKKNEQSYISFFENGSYLKYLTNVPLMYEYPNGQRSAAKPAYKWQLDRNRYLLTKNEYSYWSKKFEKWNVELKKNGVRLHGVILEAQI